MNRKIRYTTETHPIPNYRPIPSQIRVINVLANREKAFIVTQSTRRPLDIINKILEIKNKM